MDPVQSVASVTALVDGIKKVLAVAKRLKDADVQEILLDAQERALSLKEELVTLRAENLGLREQLAAKVAAEFDSGAYWSKTAEGRDGPFCSRCYDVDRRLVRMKQNLGQWHRCPQCDQAFEVTCVPPKSSPPISVRRA